MEIKTIGVIGAGTMGSGITQVAAQKGEYQVILNDIDEKFVARGMSIITKGLDRLVKKEKIDEAAKNAVLGRITTTTSIEDLAKADLIIEAASENVEIKSGIFKKLDEICAPHTILASNTSSYPITRLAATTKRPQNVVGMHFFNPAPVMKLVEVIRGLSTSDATTDTVKAVAAKLGKTVVEVNDSPGFVVNRVLVPMINEAVFLLQEGVSSAAEIDEAMKLGANHPMGPLALGDLIGLDICLHIMETLYDSFGDPKYRACPLLRKYVEAGLLGRKTGRGFFNYE